MNIITSNFNIFFIINRKPYLCSLKKITRLNFEHYVIMMHCSKNPVSDDVIFNVIHFFFNRIKLFTRKIHHQNFEFEGEKEYFVSIWINCLLVVMYTSL